MKEDLHNQHPDSVEADRPPDASQSMSEFEVAHQDVLSLLRQIQSQSCEVNASEQIRSFGDTVIQQPTDPELQVDGHDRPLTTNLKTDNELPTKIGRFQIKSLLGQGGFGMVFLAADPRLKRDIALKIPRPEAIMTGELRQRFVREAETCAALNHANIVPVFEVGSAGPICYIASAVCRGQTLTQWWAGLPEPPKFETAAELCATLADAVQHAHARGIMHRDLKPDNIMIDSGINEVTHSDYEIAPTRSLSLAKSVQITDFGLAKAIDDNSAITRTGSIVGTPAYMAPEQTESSNRDSTSTSSDIYSLGAILYFLLTGQPPFMRDSLLETITAVQDLPPTAPRKIRPDVPRDLEAICFKCLEKEPHARYESASDLESDLRRFLEGRPVVARTVSSAEHLKRWIKRNRPLSAALASLAIVIPIALVVTTALWLQSDFLRKQSDERFRLAVQRADELELAIDEMLASITKMPEVGIKGMEPLREQMLGKVNFYYDSLVSVDPADPILRRKRSVALLRHAQLKSLLSDHIGAIKIASRLLEILPAQSNCSSLQIQQRIDARMVLAREQLSLKNISAYQENSDTAVSTAKSVFASIKDPSKNDRIEYAMTLSEFAELLAVAGQRTESNQFSLEAVHEWEQVDPEDIDDGEALYLLSKSLLMAAKTHAASEKVKIGREHVAQAIQIMEMDLDVGILDSPKGQHQLSECYRTQAFCFLNDRNMAMPHFDRALQIIEDLVELHPLVPKYRVQIMNVNYQRGLCHFIASYRAKEAEADLNLALSIFLDNIEHGNELRERFPDEANLFVRPLANSLTMKGIAYEMLGDKDKQLEALVESRDLNRQIFESVGSRANQIALIGAEGNIGRFFAKENRYVEAIEKLTDTTKQLEEIIVNDPDAGEVARYLATDSEFLAKALAGDKQFDEALRWINRSIEKCKDVDAQGLLQAKKSNYLVRCGRYDEAQRAFKKFAAHQNDQNLSMKPIVMMAAELINAVDEVSEETDSMMSDFYEVIVGEAIKALEKLDTDPNIPPESLHEMLNGSKLESLKQTAAFQEWNASREY